MISPLTSYKSSIFRAAALSVSTASRESIVNSNHFIKKLILSSLLLSAGICASASAHERNWEHRWQPAVRYQREVVREYDYVYYPAQQVYFSPAKNNWFWASGAGWQVSSRLPSYLNVDLRWGGIPIRLASERPYFEHPYVERSYGNPWRTAHSGWRERDEWRAGNRAYENKHYYRRHHHEHEDDDEGNRHRHHD